ncbi:MAG: hypothetical protein RLZZ628_3542 [Bacteroidota bacterium]|jgi:subtilisin family serine protease
MLFFKQNLLNLTFFFKMIKTFKPILLLGFAAFALTNCNKEQVTSDLSQTVSPTTQGLVTSSMNTYLLEGSKVVSHTAQIRQKIADLGATETAYFPQLKAMYVLSNNSNFQTELEAMNVNVAVDMDLNATQPMTRKSFPVAPNTNLGTANQYFTSLWGLKAISAPAAWSLGYKGNGVKVAVIDGGFYLTHPDLAANFNLTLAHNFVPLAGENNPNDASFASTGFSHATHVSGILAAVDNTIGVVGVAPQAEIIPIKVLSDIQGTGQVAWIVQGIMYAADHGAKIINMSLGVTIAVRGHGRTANGDKLSIQLFKDAVKYAYDQGVTVICAAGNDAIDFDHSNLDVFPAATPHAICIAATSSENWVPNTPNTNVPL